MTRPDCTCEVLQHDVLITSPQDLRNIIRKIKALVADGVLQQYWPPDAPFATQVHIETIGESGPWVDDYIEFYFVSKDKKRRYKLSAETFHGTGGQWIVIGDS